MSFLRSTIVIKPSSSLVPRSPGCWRSHRPDSPTRQRRRRRYGSRPPAPAPARPHGTRVIVWIDVGRRRSARGRGWAAGTAKGGAQRLDPRGREAGGFRAAAGLPTYQRGAGVYRAAGAAPACGPQPVARPVSGERDNLAELRGRGMAGGQSGERGVPPVEVVGERVVEDPDTDLQQEVRAARGPAHLLLLDHALADQLVDRGLDERGRDGLAGPVALAVRKTMPSTQGARSPR